MKHTLLQRLSAVTALGTLLFQSSAVQAASSWSPTLLVNTESFQTIDVGDGTTNIELRFGSTSNKRLFYDVGNSRFHFTDDALVGGILTVTGSAVIGGTGAPTETLEVTGTASGRIVHAQNGLRSSGTLIIEGAARLNDEVTFGSGLIINGVTYRFPTSDGSATGKVLKTDGAGNLSWSSDIDTTGSTLPAQGLTQPAAGFLALSTSFSGTALEIIGTSSGRTVHAQDTLQSSGALAVDGAGFFGSTLTTVDDITMGGGNLNFSTTTTIGDGGDQITIDSNGTLVINDGVLDFSAQTVDVTLNSAADAFNFDSNTLSIDASGDRVGIGTAAPTEKLEVIGRISGSILHAQDLLTASGTLAVDGSAYFNTMSTCTLLTTVAGLLTCDGEGFDESVDDRLGTFLRAGTGITLTYNDAGNALTIEASHGSGNVVNLVPEFDGAVYYGSGAAGVGQLTYAFDSTNLHNYYRWTTTNAAIQDYWIAVRAILPKNFHAWDTNPIALNLRTDTTTTTDNHVTMRMIDTTGTNVALANVGGIASASNDTWRKVIATGPESTGTFTAGSGITLLLKLATLAAAGAGYTDLGEIELNWSTNHP